VASPIHIYPYATVLFRDLLLLAGDSVREETPVPPPKFPKTQACQTDFPPISYAEQQELEEKEKLPGAEVVEGRGSVWSWFRALVGSILVLLLLFMLLPGVEYRGRVYTPFPYSPLRWVQTIFLSLFPEHL
jgi:hypothetical protein